MTEPDRTDDGLQALADEIESSDGLYYMVSKLGKHQGYQLGIKKTAQVIAALRTAPQAPDTGEALYFEPSGDGMGACIHNANGAIICEAKYEDFENDPSEPERIMRGLVEAKVALAAEAEACALIVEKWLDDTGLRRAATDAIRSRAAAPPKPAPDALREALEPFAKAADLWDGDVWENSDPLDPKDRRNKHLTVGDLRRAKTALSAPVPSGEGTLRHHANETLEEQEYLLREVASPSPAVAAEPECGWANRVAALEAALEETTRQVLYWKDKAAAGPPPQVSAGPHTPLPWSMRSDGWQPWEGAIQIVGANGEIIAYTSAGANEKVDAPFIVAACNSFVPADGGGAR